MVRLLSIRSPILPNMSGLPREHRHVLNSGTELRRDVQQVGINLATIQHTIEKRPLVRCQIEQEGESFATKRNGLVNPRVDLSPGAETVARQADREFLAKLARVDVRRRPPARCRGCRSGAVQAGRAVKAVGRGGRNPRQLRQGPAGRRQGVADAALDFRIAADRGQDGVWPPAADPRGTRKCRTSSGIATGAGRSGAGIGPRRG